MKRVVKRCLPAFRFEWSDQDHMKIPVVEACCPKSGEIAPREVDFSADPADRQQMIQEALMLTGDMNIPGINSLSNIRSRVHAVSVQCRRHRHYDRQDG